MSTPIPGASPRVRPRSAWRGVSAGDAFRPETDPTVRLLARHRFHERCADTLAALWTLLGEPARRGMGPAQIGPAMDERWPAEAGAHAAIGLTAWLAFQAMTALDSLLRPIAVAAIEANWRDAPGAAGAHRPAVAVDREAGRLVAEAVAIRIGIEQLRREPRTEAVETYRLFAAAGLDLSLRTLCDAIRAPVVFGDLLPPLADLSLHHVTAGMVDDLARASRAPSRRLRGTAVDDLLRLGETWTRDAATALAHYLPAYRAEAVRRNSGKAGQITTGRQEPRAPVLEIPTGTTRREAVAPDGGEPMAGRTNSAGGETAPAHILSVRLHEIMEAGLFAVGCPDEQCDSRATQARDAAFARSAFEDAPPETSVVRVALPDGRVVEGAVTEYTLAPSPDPARLAMLRADIVPLVAALRRAVPPSVTREPSRLRPASSGRLDAGRLPVAAIAGAVFERPVLANPVPDDRTGLLVLAVDGSSSLGAGQARMARLLAGAWVQVSTPGRFLAAVYAGGGGNSHGGPTVAWAHHPRKSPALGHLDALRCVAGLSEDTGTGAQADAISLRLILDEAAILAAGTPVHLVVLSDCRWNRSFHDGLEADAEVSAVLGAARDQAKGGLTFTLLALGSTEPGAVARHADRLVRLKDHDLADPALAAGHIITSIGHGHWPPEGRRQGHRQSLTHPRHHHG